MKIIITVLTSLILLSSSYILLTNRDTIFIRDFEIQEKLEELNILISDEEVYREVIYTKTTGDIFWIPLRNKEMLFSIEYKVVTGIDLSKGYTVNRGLDSLQIELPDIEIISIDADDNSINQYFTKERFSTINREDYFSIINETKYQLENSDSIKNLLNESRTNSKNIVKSLFKAAGIDVEVKFKRGTK